MKNRDYIIKRYSIQEKRLKSCIEIFKIGLLTGSVYSSKFTQLNNVPDHINYAGTRYTL